MEVIVRHHNRGALRLDQWTIGIMPPEA